MKEILDFSTSVMWRNLKLIHMWTNFSFLQMFHVQNFEISPHDRFFLHGPGLSACDKYELCFHSVPIKTVQSSKCLLGGHTGEGAQFLQQEGSVVLPGNLWDPFATIIGPVQVYGGILRIADDGTSQEEEDAGSQDS